MRKKSFVLMALLLVRFPPTEQQIVPLITPFPLLHLGATLLCQSMMAYFIVTTVLVKIPPVLNECNLEPADRQWINALLMDIQTMIANSGMPVVREEIPEGAKTCAEKVITTISEAFQELKGKASEQKFAFCLPNTAEFGEAAEIVSTALKLVASILSTKKITPRVPLSCETLKADTQTCQKEKSLLSSISGLLADSKLPVRKPYSERCQPKKRCETRDECLSSEYDAQCFTGWCYCR